MGGNQGRNFRERRGGKNGCRGYERMLATGLLLQPCSVGFPGSHSGLDPSTSMSIKKINAPESCFKAHVVEVPISQMTLTWVKWTKI